jgi:hypothetical protein
LTANLFMQTLTNKHKSPRWKFIIPANVKVVFVFSTGRKYNMDSKLFKELSEIYSWMVSRLDEFQQDITLLSTTTREGKLTVFEISYDGKKKIFHNLDTNDYSMN